MRATTLILTAVLAGALPGAAPSYAGPADLPAGRKCAFSSTVDVTAPPGRQTGDINAGPLLTAQAGTLVCSIHVDNNTHSGPAVVSEPVAAAAGAVVVMARTLNYQATAADTVSVCTQWVPDSGPALYWVGRNVSVSNPFGGHWSTDPSDPCSVFGEEGPNEPECGIWLAIDKRAGTDIAGTWQDCEPYEPII
jgi:hypothetical protein